MQVHAPRATRFARWCLPGLILFACAGCDDDPTDPGDESPPPEPVREFWLGTYATEGAGPDKGAITLDVLRTGNEVVGEFVFLSRLDDSTWSHLFVGGRREGNVYKLGPDRERIDYQYDFMIEVTVDDQGELAGSLSHPRAEGARLLATPVPVEHFRVESVIALTQDVFALAYAGDAMWASTISHDYLLLDDQGQVTAQAEVFLYGDLHWTSDSLTSDGETLWGHLPSSYNGQSTSNIYRFSKEGEILSEFRLWHRTRGLSFADGNLWSLHNQTATLRRFDESGQVLEELPTGLPEAVHLEAAGSQFLTLDWFLDRIYLIEHTGKVLAVYDLPEDDHRLWPVGIAHDGVSLWCATAVNDPAYQTRIYKLTPVARPADDASRPAR